MTNTFETSLCSRTKLWAGSEHVSLKPVYRVYVQTVTLTVDPDFWFSHATYCHDYSCQVILKFHHAGRSYGRGMILEQTNKHTHDHNGRVNSKALTPFYGGSIQMIGWLFGCFGFNGLLRQYLSLFRAVSQREGVTKKN